MNTTTTAEPVANATIASTLDAYDRRIHATFAAAKKSRGLGKVKGNFAVIVHEHAQWTVITKGPRAGVYRELLEDDMDFILVTTADVFHSMNATATEAAAMDHDEVIEQRKLALHGDIEVYERFAAMAGQREVSAVGARFTSLEPKPKKKTRPRQLLFGA